MVESGGGLRWGGGGRGAVLVLSQQIEPCLQLLVLWIIIEGRSQNAAIMLSRQNPGQRGAGGGVVGRGGVATLSLSPVSLSVQQLPSPGQ